MSEIGGWVYKCIFNAKTSTQILWQTL